MNTVHDDGMHMMTAYTESYLSPGARGIYYATCLKPQHDSMDLVMREAQEVRWKEGGDL